MTMVQKLVTEDSFDARGTLVKEGQIGIFDTESLSGKEPHLHAVPSLDQPVVQIAPIAPTGPNPTVPQQIPPDAFQLPGGGYAKPGATFTAERTLDADQRLLGLTEADDTAEGDMAEELAKLREENAKLRAAQRSAQEGVEQANPFAGEGGNVGNEPVEGNAKDIIASLGGKTDAELHEIEVAEKDNERPRKTVLDAVKAELSKRGQA